MKDRYSYCLKIHGKNIYGIVDPSSTRIFHFWRMKKRRRRRKQAARLYIYFPYGEISKNKIKIINSAYEKIFISVFISVSLLKLLYIVPVSPIIMGTISTFDNLHNVLISTAISVYARTYCRTVFDRCYCRLVLLCRLCGPRLLVCR